MALFKSPPLISPLFNSASNSCKKLNVLQSAISDLKSEMFFILAFCVPKTFVPKSTIAVTQYPSLGIIVISLPVASSKYEITSFTTYILRSASCSTQPTFSNASTKYFEEPSIIGNSDEFNSIITLSKSQPTKAAKTCSGV